MIYRMTREYRGGSDKEALGGRMIDVRVLDDTLDGGRAFMPGDSMNGGRPIDPTHLPHQIKLGRKKGYMVDIFFGFGGLIASPAAERVIEEVEPGVHQFFPVEMVWSRAGHAGNYKWFIVCNRLNTIDAERSDPKLDGPIWMGTAGKSTLVLREDLAAGHHIWVERHTSGGFYASETFAEAARAAGLSGIGFEPQQVSHGP